MRNQRPAALIAATVICVLNSLGNLAILPSPLPRPLIYASGLAAVAGLVGAFGLWLVKLFGEAGRPARSAVGMASLPLNSAVEIEGVVEV